MFDQLAGVIRRIKTQSFCSVSRLQKRFFCADVLRITFALCGGVVERSNTTVLKSPRGFPAPKQISTLAHLALHRMPRSESAVSAISPEPIDPNQILTLADISARLKVSQRWVYEKIRNRCQDPLPCIRIGRYLRFHWLDVSSWLRKQSTGEVRP